MHNLKIGGHRLLAFLFLASALLLPAPATSQPTAAAPKRDDGVPKLVLAPDPTVGKGQVAVVQGNLGPQAVRYSVGGLSILQPVVVMLLSRDPADDLAVSVFKNDWTTARRQGTTKGTGIAQFEFRTEGAVNILLRGPSTPKPFALVVWAGNELHPPMSDVLVAPNELRKRTPVPKRDARTPRDDGR